MPRIAALTLIGVVAIGLAGLLITGLGDERQRAFTLGVAPTGVAAVLTPGDQVCQAPVRVADDFNIVNFQVGTYKRPGTPMEVTVRSPDGVARGRLPGGFRDGLEQRVDVGRVDAGREVSVCIKNVGSRRMAIYGNAGAAARLTRALLDGRDQDVDLTLVFERESRSALAAVPDVFDHASRFRPGWLEPWLFWVLGALVLFGAPIALALALGWAVRCDDDPPPADDRPRDLAGATHA